ncbi:MAG: hypothetical protein HOD58_02915 [Gammaproteobacteria bacterium]|jgi:hypothetical protein|nr:hypothetical protein [Gammaproteobacteria bacterium]MBT8006168.1 hypothetical protein [Gammaproteobacteria bacterium]
MNTFVTGVAIFGIGYTVWGLIRLDWFDVVAGLVFFIVSFIINLLRNRSKMTDGMKMAAEIVKKQIVEAGDCKDREYHPIFGKDEDSMFYAGYLKSLYYGVSRALGEDKDGDPIMASDETYESPCVRIEVR